MQGDPDEELGPDPGAAAAPVHPRVQGHGGRPFSAAEEDELRRGVALHGTGAWAAILRTGSFAAQRTNVDLKDKWRNMVKAGEPTPADTPPPPPGGGGGEARPRAKRPLSPYSPATGPEVGGAPRQRGATPATPATPATAAAATAAAASAAAAAAAACVEMAEVASVFAAAAPAAAAAAATGWRRKGPDSGVREPIEADLLGLAPEQREVVHLALQGKSFLVTGPGGCGEPGYLGL